MLQNKKDEKTEVLENFNKVRNILDYAKRGDIGAAELYADCYKGRRVYKGKSWYKRLDTGFWEADEGGAVLLDIGKTISGLFVKDLQKYIQSGAKQSDVATLTGMTNYLMQVRGISQVKKAAQSCLAHPGAWDDLEKESLIACENGIIDKKGNIRDPKPTEYARSKAPTIWEGIDTPAPLWEKTISEIFQGDKEIIDFVHRLFGYAISGAADERIFPIFYGGGANGKTVIIEVITGVLGENYRMTTSSNAVMEAKFETGGDSPTPFIVALKSKRVLWVAESKEGQRLDTSLVKRLTGRDTISGRLPHEKEYITFKPTFTPFLITNDLPHISAEDQAIWDRVLPVEFGARFVANPTKPNERKKIKALEDKILSKERAGVMAWLMRGYIEYQRIGLNVPPKILQWRDEYREAEDDFTPWVDTLNTSDPAIKTTSKELYREYKSWAALEDVYIVSKPAFDKRMSSRFKHGKNNKGKFYQGVKI